MFDEASVKQNQELAPKKRAVSKELLGVELEEKPDLLASFNPLEQMLDLLPSSKQRQVLESQQTFAARMAKVRGATDEEVRRKKLQMLKEMDNELAGIMTSEEKWNYDLRLSTTAMSLRSQLTAFDVNEQEFKGIFQLRKQLDDEFGPTGLQSQDTGGSSTSARMPRRR